MPKLSVVMIVKNEADCLADCLNSLGDIADDIVIGDTGSTDDTVRIAEAHGACVLNVPWEDDFARARTQVLESASGEWMLHMDADEQLDVDGARRIRALVDADGNGADAIEVTLANYCDDPRAWRWAPAAPDNTMARGYSGYIAAPLLRLFRNHRGYEYREPVHENITESVREKGGVIRPEPIIIHHYGYRPADKADAAKAEMYLGIGRKKVGQRPDDPKAWHDLAEQLLACGEAGEAEEACRKALELDRGHAGAATALANLLLNRGETDEAKKVLRRLLSNGQGAPHVLTALGAIACREGKMKEAQRWLELALAAQPGHFLALLYLARVEDLEERPAMAREILQHAVDTYPRLEEAKSRVAAHELRSEAASLYRHGNLRGALEKLVEALRLDPEDPLIHNGLGRALLALGDLPRARQSFTRALQLANGYEAAKTNLRNTSPAT
ncbi:MAG: tetratricopeptide repeat protein [Candidatus Hydrogenedentes bacterium]|nr:tetratricopeptide repeat protein [Candidatus Hydrogenedentota bacterium]